MPFALGFAFKQGDIPSGQGVVASQGTTQVTIKNRWPDGSAKFAVVAGQVAMTAGVPLTVSLSAGSPAAAAALNTANLKATGIAASVGCGSFGTASWSGTDWDAPFQSWVAGPEMSSWIYRKPVGSDAHLVAWLEVRLFKSGAVEVLPWIENGYIRVAGPTSKSATYTFTLGGTQRFGAAINLPHHTRTVLVNGSTLSHWLGSDPGLSFRHDTAYLQGTHLVPTYRGSVAASAAVVSSLPATYTPLQLGSYFAPMGGTGYQRSIGLLPEWDVLYLTAAPSVSNAVLGGVIRNGYSAGRWPTHYRDENTNRPLRFSQFPNLSRNASTTSDYLPAASGTAPDGWDIPHHPSLGYMAYLVTGRWYFMEEVLFTATMNYLTNTDGGPYPNRSFSAGIFRSDAGANTVRGAAWAIRTLAQAVTAVPDDDTALRNELISSFESNIDFNHAKYVAQPNNPFGVVKTYGDAYGTSSDGKVTEAPWQQDFYTAAFGYALAMNPPVSAAAKTKLSAFFAWKARSVIGRLGGTASTDWLYRDASVYNFIVAFVDAPDWDTGTGPWPASWGAMYQATLGVANPGVTGNLRGGNWPESTSYWGNLQPAIAYAVQHSVPGALDAYNRMVNAANWSDLSASFNSTPVWSVRPSGN